MNRPSKAPRPVVVGCLLFLLAPLILIGSYLTYVAVENHGFAHDFFADHVEIEKIIASKKWHHEWVGCTYAIATFSKATARKIRHEGPSTLPARKLKYGVWRVNWIPTPLVVEKDDFSMLDMCLSEASPAYAHQIIEALTQEGSYYAIGESGGRAFLSPEYRIIGWIRYGD